jgi:two-component system sensor histidine kinase AlgZ
VQRLLCGLVPALIAAAVASLINHLQWLFSDFLHASTVQMSVLAAFFGMLFQQHFELRARAFSPALGEAKLKALQARIRPHFLFNSINAVLSLIRTEPQRAETALEDLADLFRVLMRDTRDVSTLQDELQLCHQYLSIEKIRLGERLKVEWEISNLSELDIQQGQIASLLLQPLIENAVHHGVEPSAGPSVISVRLWREVDQIFIVVENPFFPTHATRGNRMALNNIQERLKLLYDVETSFVAEVVGGQFQVRLNYPFQKMTGSGNDREPGVERRTVLRTDTPDKNVKADVNGSH